MNFRLKLNFFKNSGQRSHEKTIILNSFNFESNNRYRCLITELDLKIVVLGAASVGKTSIINRYCNGQFMEETLSTIGAGFFTHSIELNGKEITLLLWDTAGEERFKSVAPSLLRGANAMVLVYDCQTPASFNEIDVYMEMFLDNVDTSMNSTIPVLLLGNKLDLGTPLISHAQIDAWKQKTRVELDYYVSAKTGENIKEAMSALVSIVAEPPVFVQDPLHIDVTPEKKGCCS